MRAGEGLGTGSYRADEIVQRNGGISLWGETKPEQLEGDGQGWKAKTSSG